MSGETVLGRDAEGRVRQYDLATQQELDAGGSPAATPTLADVLAEGPTVGVAHVIGPFAVAYDTPGIEFTGGDPMTLGAGGFCAVAPLADGAIVVAAWAEVATEFNGGNDMLTILVQPIDDPDLGGDLGPLWALGTTSSAPTVYADAHAGQAILLNPKRVITGAELSCKLTSDVPATVGAANIYALVQYPVVS